MDQRFVSPPEFFVSAIQKNKIYWRIAICESAGSNAALAVQRSRKQDGDASC